MNLKYQHLRNRTREMSREMSRNSSIQSIINQSSQINLKQLQNENVDNITLFEQPEELEQTLTDVLPPRAIQSQNSLIPQVGQLSKMAQQYSSYQFNYSGNSSENKSSSSDLPDNYKQLNHLSQLAKSQASLNVSLKKVSSINQSGSPDNLSLFMDKNYSNNKTSILAQKAINASKIKENLVQIVVENGEQLVQLIEFSLELNKSTLFEESVDIKILNEMQQMVSLTIKDEYFDRVKSIIYNHINKSNKPPEFSIANSNENSNNSNQEMPSIQFDSHQEQSYSVLMDDPHSKEKSSNTLEVQQQLETVVSQELSHQQQVQSILKLIKEQEQLQQECTQKSPKIHINQKEQEKMYKQLIKFNKQVQKQIAKMQKQQQKLLNNIEMLKQQEMMMVDLYRMQFANNSMLTHITYNIVINMQNMPDNSYLLLSDCFNELMKNIQIKQLTTKDLCIVCNDSDLDQVKQYLNLVELNEKKLTYRIDIEHYEGKQKDIEQQLNYVVIVNMKGLPKYYSSIFYEHFQEIIQCNSIKILRNNNIEIVCQKQQLENVKNAVSIKVDNQILQFTYKMK
ncbi:Hypothetical_protein [Hexamita inflata]|uniref:Hypothetical_protein n=1 Tax=Hexamita inflata TaxID=28002 RepID=A0AA86RUW0_9EUKA|nr:Hypothetical protein HINF_LOCUS60655 [Hexamita inflata]